MMAAPKHHKHCTFKRTQVCVCANIDAALKDQAAKHTKALDDLRLQRHKRAVEDYREGIIRAFTNLIDERFETESNCDCSINDWRKY